jgi:hypothetical protein
MQYIYFESRIHESTVFSFVEVSGHKLEISQTGGFCMDFLHHREGGMVFFQVSSFLLYNVQ